MDSTILVVDDEALTREILGEMLTDEGYRVAFASNGVEALAQAAELTPDLILLDVRMPVMDGFEVCRRLRATPHLAELPVIIITAFADRQARLRGIEAGADDFIAKPFDVEELQARVRTVTRLDRYRRLFQERTQRQQAESERDAVLEALQQSKAELEHSNQALSDRVAVLEALHQIGVAMTSQLETDTLMQFIVETATNLVNATSCSILLPDEETGELVFHAAADGIIGMRVPPGQGIAARALRECVPQLIQDVAADPDHYRGIEQKGSESIRSLLTVPLPARDKAIGVLTAINKREGHFGEQDQTLLMTLASYAAIAIENSRLYERALQEVMQRRQAQATLAELNATLEERVRQRTFDLQVLHNLSREIGSIRGAEAFVRLLLSNLSYTIFHDVAAGILVAEGSCKFFVQPMRPLSAAVQQEIEKHMLRSLTHLSGKEIGLEQWQLSTQTLEAAGFDAERPAVTALGSTFQVPLVISQEAGVLGLLFVGAEQEEAFNEHQIRLLYTIASQASLFLSVRHSEEQLLAALQEKEVLLKEIHHRVKNNLQVVSSLLKLQSEYCDDPRTVDAFRESQNRVKSMALVHERLYRSQDMARIDFGEYIRSLARDLFRSYNAQVSGITLKVDAANSALDIDRATPCGLITNELISNALKHAFPNGQAGEICVGLSLSDGVFRLAVRDNGVGFPENLDFRKTDTLGLKLIQTLVRQLKGTFTVRSQDGTEIEVRFPA
jgi:two-component sensor histidine kinase/DNA-binding response OmpR family regulator